MRQMDQISSKFTCTAPNLLIDWMDDRWSVLTAHSADWILFGLPSLISIGLRLRSIGSIRSIEAPSRLLRYKYRAKDNRFRLVARTSS